MKLIKYHYHVLMIKDMSLMMEYILSLIFIKIFLLKKLILIIKKNCDKNMRMNMTNDDNDNDSSNLNETIKTFYFFDKKLLQAR